MIFGSNIKLLRKRQKLTQDDLAVRLGMKRSTLSGYENNIAQPSIEALILLSEYYKISIDTLVKIDFSKLSERLLTELENGEEAFVRGDKIRVLTTVVSNDNRENIALVNQRARAGYTSGYSDPEYIGKLPQFRLPFLSRERTYRTFQIEGESMLPIPTGAWVTGEFVQDWILAKTGDPYIILTQNDGIVFKIIENCIEKDQKFILHSLNYTYKPYDLHVNQIREMWKFINYISPQLPEPRLKEDDIIAAISKLRHDIDMLHAKKK